VIFPDGRRGTTTATNSFNWLVGVQHDEDHERSLANLMVGNHAHIETTVTKPQGSWGAPFEPEIWVVPVAPPAPRPSAPLREARPDPSRLERQADRAVARNDRELYSDLESHLRGEVLRILTAAEAPSAATRLRPGSNWKRTPWRGCYTCSRPRAASSASLGNEGSSTTSRHEIADVEARAGSPHPPSIRLGGRAPAGRSPYADVCPGRFHGLGFRNEARDILARGHPYPSFFVPGGVYIEIVCHHKTG
jgi:hypothetical protein